MKPHTDHPDLTAFALGEADATHVGAWMSDSTLRREAEQISDLALHLQATAPLPTVRLHPDQRSSVLSPPERVRQLVAVAAQKQSRRAPSAMPLFWGSVKWAAAAALVAASFEVGRQISAPSAEQPQLAVAKTPTAAPSLPPKTTSVLVKAPQAPLPVIAKTTPTPALKIAPTPKEVPQQSLVLQAPRVVAPRVSLAFPSFTNSTKTASTQQSLDTTQLLAPASQSITSASPLRSAPASQTKREKTQAPLFIHSWSAEVMACPWGTDSRLIRLALQLPSSQARDSAFSIQASFDPVTVRSHRYLGQRLLPGVDAQSAAQVVAWYEVQPNGQPGNAQSPRQLGVIHLPDSRFTTSTMAPFDGSNLRILDRGTTASESRPEFRYDSALIGFTLLTTPTVTGPRPSLTQLMSLVEGSDTKHAEELELLLRQARALRGE